VASCSSRVGVAAAGSLVVLGVAIQDAITPEAFTSAPVSGVLNEAQNPTRVGLAYGGDEAPVTYAANTTFGQKLIAAAAGKVTPAGATPDARTIVGTCAEEAGVLANAVGLMRTI
jgi:hypothetical protein